LGKELPKAYALLVGVSHYDTVAYREKKQSTLSPLFANGVQTDIRHVKEMLLLAGYKEKNIFVLENSNATITNVKFYFHEIMGKVEMDDVFTFYFSGHGRRIETDKAMKSKVPKEWDKTDEALLLFDGYLKDNDLKNLWTQYSKSNRGTSSVKLKIPHLIFVVDACYGKGMFDFLDYKDSVSLEKLQMVADILNNPATSDSVSERYKNYLPYFQKVYSSESSDSTWLPVLKDEYDLLYINASNASGTAIITPSGSAFTEALYECFLKDYHKPYFTFDYWLQQTTIHLSSRLNIYTFAFDHAKKVEDRHIQQLFQRYPFQPFIPE
jgi:hypothetical protein